MAEHEPGAVDPERADPPPAEPATPAAADAEPAPESAAALPPVAEPAPAPAPAAEAAPAPAVPHVKEEVAEGEKPRIAAPWEERPEVAETIPRGKLAAASRRDFLLLAAGTAAGIVGGWWLLPDRFKSRLVSAPAHDRLDTLAARVGLSREAREKTLNRALTFDDDIAEALYSKERRVRTYSRSEITPLRSNYAGQIPGPESLVGWKLQLAGLASGRSERLGLDELLARFPQRDQVTRLCCVEGWSAIAWWGGLRFSDLLAAFPPAPGARWAALRAENSLDGHGQPDPYYVSIDLETARHPQTLLATHFTGQPLPLAHGAPLRLLVPMKLGLKNIKGITHITYTADEPPDYWAELGYSKYDGL